MAWQRYLGKLKLPGKEGGVPCLVAAAELFHANVFVVTDANSEDEANYSHLYTPRAASSVRFPHLTLPIPFVLFLLLINFVQPHELIVSLANKHYMCLARDASIAALPPSGEDYMWYCRVCLRENFVVEVACHSCQTPKSPPPGNISCTHPFIFFCFCFLSHEWWLIFRRSLEVQQLHFRKRPCRPGVLVMYHWLQA